MRDLYLAIDVGTGGVRAALVGQDGRLLALTHREHEQLVPQFGWSEQRPAEWWLGTVTTIRDVLKKVDSAPNRIAAICTCGQMHGTVLIDDDGRPTRTEVPLWNDKRTAPQVADFASRVSTGDTLSIAANMPSTAWPAFKLAWIAENDPDAMARSSTVLMPKDWINFQLTGERAQDVTEASLSFLMDWRSRTWSAALCEATGVDQALLPPLHHPADVLGTVMPQVAHELGLSHGIPVLVGAGDYPMALIGSGVIRPGMGSDVTGTSTIITVLNHTAVIDPEVSNVLSANGVWGAMTLLDAGGDAVRWARRAFHENRRSYADVAEDAARATAGSQSLFFLPYLSGERFNPRSRAQYFGLTASHGLAELHRAVLEGVAFSVRQTLDRLQDGQGRPERMVAAGGGAKNTLWLQIKASMYNVPYLVPQELECGVVGAAMLMATATGEAPDIAAAADRMVRFVDEVKPRPDWTEMYDRMMPIYSRLYDCAQELHDELESLE